LQILLLLLEWNLGTIVICSESSLSWGFVLSVLWSLLLRFWVFPGLAGSHHRLGELIDFEFVLSKVLNFWLRLFLLFFQFD